MSKELSKLEVLKASRNPLRVIDDMYEEAIGGTPLSDEHIGLLKWYGMYPHINHGDTEDKKYFMKRIKLVDTTMNLEQLKIMSFIAKEYAQGLVDFTVRQNIQFHYIQIKDIPEIIRLLDSVNLTSRMASGDGPRPIMACPVSGLDVNEVYDAKHLVKEIDTYFDVHEDEFCNFPRKYKIGVSGCSCNCPSHEIQDVSFTAFKDDSGEVLFDLCVAGGLAKSKQIAYRAKRYVKVHQVKDIAIVCAEIFREYGNRANRGKARVRHLVNDWGLEKFVDEIENKLGYKLQFGEHEPSISSSEKRNHFGINESKIPNESYVGFATNSGRIAGEDFEKISQILEKYEAAGLSLTASQNFVVYGVKNDVVQKLADEINDLGYPYEPSPFRARLNACTGIEFCKFAITETKVFAHGLIEKLEKKYPDFKENVTIAVSGCGNGCSHPQISDIGFVGCKVRDEEGNRVEAYDVLIGGKLEGELKSQFARKINTKIEASKVFDYICTLIALYEKDENNHKNFKSFLSTYSL